MSSCSFLYDALMQRTGSIGITAGYAAYWNKRPLSVNCMVIRPGLLSWLLYFLDWVSAAVHHSLSVMTVLVPAGCVLILPDIAFVVSRIE